ncbi:MAG: dihydroorotate dehydrogenase-like protein [Pseudomonadota bacterium]
MIDLKTNYLGLTLKHPIMPGASPLTEDFDQVKRLEDGGASAIVMHSLFEEQILAEQKAAGELDEHDESFGEALSYLPDPKMFRIGPDAYLEQIRKIKAAVDVPVIASLNGTTWGGWTRYATLMEEAGADALELNVYQVPTDPSQAAAMIEGRLLDLITSVRQRIHIPIAVKLSPFFTSWPNLASRLDEVPVAGLVLFNRFYQPDIDIQELKIERRLQLSTSAELPLRLHGLALLSGRVRASLAASGGVHTGVDVLKALMSGAHAAQVVSELLAKGVERLKTMRQEMLTWMEENEYSSVEQMIGSMNFTKNPDPRAFERLNYMEVLKSWK